MGLKCRRTVRWEGMILENIGAGFGDMALVMVLCSARLPIGASEGLFSSTHLMIINVSEPGNSV